MGKHTFAGSGLLVQPIIIIPVITYSSLIATPTLHVKELASPTRVESGLDDSDNLGHLDHFFGGLIRKLNYLNVTHISHVSDECTEISLV